MTMRAMSTAALAIRSMAEMTCRTDAISSASRRVAGGEDAHGPHVVHEGRHRLLELVDLLGHVGVAEVQRRVGEVDHQLGGVLGLGEHRPQVSPAFFHGGWLLRLLPVTRIGGQTIPRAVRVTMKMRAPTKSTELDTTGMP